MRKSLSALALCLLLLGPGPKGRTADERPRPEAPPWDPVENYVKQQREGWKVLVNKKLLDTEHRNLREKVLRLLDDHLYRIARVIPPEPLAKLRKIPIWVELYHPRHPCMCYHPSAEWLRQHGMNPQKAGGVEIANARNFLSWTHAQPWMVLHELAHGYHHQVLGFDNAEVRACYDRAVASKVYESVLHVNGRKERHYALTNDREYFAETTEAYFGTNDFYPFVRAELRQVDPGGYALMEKLWGVKTAGKNRRIRPQPRDGAGRETGAGRGEEKKSGKNLDEGLPSVSEGLYLKMVAFDSGRTGMESDQEP